MPGLLAVPQSQRWNASLERADRLGGRRDPLIAFLENVCVPLEKATTNRGPLAVHGPMISELFLYVLGFAQGCYASSPEAVRMMVAALDFAVSPEGDRVESVLCFVLDHVKDELQEFRAWRTGG